MRQITDGTTYTSQYLYNFAGALVQETYPSGRVVRNEYESDGDLSRIWGKKDANAPERTYANSFSYTASGGIERMKLGNNRWETAKFNERAQLTQIGIGVGVTDDSVWKLEYKYGELESGSVNANKNTGNIAQMVMTIGGMANPIVQNYQYDSLYRLTDADEKDGLGSNAAQNWIQHFQYDRFGNRTALAQTVQRSFGAVQTNTTPAIDPATNRFVASNQNFRYDKNGNLTTDGDNRTVVFNGENKQAEIKNASGQTIGQYYFDGEGKRVKKITWDANGHSETTIFVYSAGKLVAEYSDTQVPVANPTTRYLTEDHLGTPRVVTDSQGNVISRRDFLPFGEQLDPDVGGRSSVTAYQPTNDNVKQKFTGYQKDEETGLDFAEARMYENRHARFTAVDPLLASGRSANPQTFNRYVYVGNSPIGRIDPSGLDWWYNKVRNIYTWSDDGKVTDNGDEINDDWTKVNVFYYWAGEETGFVAPDPNHRTWETGFDSEDEALFASDPPSDWQLSDGVNEMLDIYDGITVVGMFTDGIARKGLIKGGRIGADYLIRKSVTETLRETAEKILTESGRKATRLAVNKLVGKLAEEFAKEELIRRGFEILGSNVSVRLSDGSYRFVDHLVKKGDEIIAYEIKSGGATRSSMQRAKDEIIEKVGGTLGNNAPDALKGKTIKMKTVEKNVDDF